MHGALSRERIVLSHSTTDKTKRPLYFVQSGQTDTLYIIIIQCLPFIDTGGPSTTCSLDPSPPATNEAGVSRQYTGAGTSKSTSDFDSVKVYTVNS